MAFVVLVGRALPAWFSIAKRTKNALSRGWYEAGSARPTVVSKCINFCNNARLHRGYRYVALISKK